MLKISIPSEGIETLFGSYDENLKSLEKSFAVQIKTNGHELLVTGSSENAASVGKVISQLGALVKEGYPLSNGDVRRASELISEDLSVDLRDYFIQAPLQTSTRKQVRAKSINQRQYFRCN